jgi:ATP-dependent metalloprotease FtsH
LRLLDTEKSADAVEKLKTIRVGVCVNPSDGEVSRMFQNQSTPEVLVFAERDVLEQCRKGLSGVTVHATDSIEDAKEILFNRDISIILCDVRCKTKDPEKKLLNAEDIDSVGRDFLDYVLLRYATPVYLIESEQGSISREEFLSFARRGVREVLTVSAKKENDFKEKVLLKCDVAYQQGNMLKLAKENKVLSYETAQTLSKNRKNAEIELFNFRLGLATDTEDSGNILDNVHKPSLHFADVIGAEDAKGELAYFVEYLRDPVRYMRKGVRAPKGILLYGPPGTGKTMLAKAMAGESDVTFLTAEGNRFLKKYVGEGAEAVHALFRSARKYAPSILFIDEIDAIGKDRNATGLNDSTSDVLTAFLTEMDGFNTDTSKPVFVLAATNYGVEPGKGKSLDAALLRRFDRRIYVDLPNKEERRRFLEMKMKGHMSVSLSDEQMDNIALRSTGMSLAELESIFEMALRSAIRSDSGSVGNAAFEEAFETYQSGEKKEWNPDSLLRTARHEAGHALLCRLGGERPTYLTIVARGDHGGYMQHENSEGKGLYTKQELLHKIRTALGGRAAEMVYYGKEEGISTGASGDLRSATSIAEQMICAYGMDETVGLAYIADPATPEVRARVNAVLAEQMQKALALIEENKAAIDKLVEVLLERNHLKGDEIEAILGEYLNQL